ncbi:glycoside hydrolase family 3 N-terminal domain-containing protein [Nocardioides speluncae]|uniref:glycoside hydrolase family 3 N-terminal domain-containing protein n=1 Tax=Nocardioides speluncae TaxID=2670337 RepID=UPI000D6941A8|nr:glycoside hydrolase family 3 N-terminal domain-containing protein [Nocardioides speluncae]
MRLRLLLAAAATASLAACAVETSGPSGDPSPSQDRAPSTAAEEAPATGPLGWGPTAGELDQARELIADWDSDRLAGQLIVGRYAGTDPAEVRALVEKLHLAGVCVTSDNVADTDQVMATTQAVRDAMAADGRDFPAVIGVDQEGGTVSHLRGVATDFPPFASAGAAIEADRKQGRKVVRQASYAMAMELRALGFTWVFAPVADVTIGAADPTIGSRSPSEDPKIAARATAAAVKGFNAAGVVSTTKHFPGHGGVTSDSHTSLPVLSSTFAELEKHDLVPFRAGVQAGAPAVMMSHIAVEAFDARRPASLAPAAYDVLRDTGGFQGIAITDSMGMGAVMGFDQPGIKALVAGADLLLMPADTAKTHAAVSRAIESGRIPRERAEEAAARVIAVQLWQQRIAANKQVPTDVVEKAQTASDKLADLGG